MLNYLLFNYSRVASKSRILVLPLNGQIDWENDESDQFDALMNVFHHFLPRVLEKPTADELQTIKNLSSQLKEVFQKILRGAEDLSTAH